MIVIRGLINIGVSSVFIIHLGDTIMDEQFVSIGKAAKRLGMRIEWLRKWEREGQLIVVGTLTNHRGYRGRWQNGGPLGLSLLIKAIPAYGLGGIRGTGGTHWI